MSHGAQFFTFCTWLKFGQAEVRCLFQQCHMLSRFTLPSWTSSSHLSLSGIVQQGCTESFTQLKRSLTAMQTRSFLTFTTQDPPVTIAENFHAPTVLLQPCLVAHTWQARKYSWDIFLMKYWGVDFTRQLLKRNLRLLWCLQLASGWTWPQWNFKKLHHTETLQTCESFTKMAPFE